MSRERATGQSLADLCHNIAFPNPNLKCDRFSLGGLARPLRPALTSAFKVKSRFAGSGRARPLVTLAGHDGDGIRLPLVSHLRALIDDAL
jgi:hypothetical protein